LTGEKTILKTKLIKLLATFSTLEWKRFGRFVQSPYHNTNQRIIDLYTYLKKAFPFEDLKTLEQERIYKKIYRKVPFKLNTFQSLCSDLYGLAADFIIDVHLQQEKRKRDKVLIDALSKRNYELFKGNSQQLIKEVETQDYFLDSDDFLLLHQLNDKLFHHIEMDKFTIQKIELEKSWRYLNAFYTNTNVQFSAEHKGAQNFLNHNINAEYLTVIELTELFQEVINLHKAKESIVYFQLKKKVLANWHKLKTKHKTDLLIHLLNFSVTNELIQKENGYSEVFDLYKIGVREALFIINGKMRDIEFVNIGMIGFGLKEYQWTETFLQNHQQYISESLKDFLIPFLYAYKANAQQNYELVVELLSQVNPTNQLLYLAKIKSLLIRAYFEGLIIGEEAYENPLSHEIDSFKKMMTRNNKLSTLKKKSYLNFLSLMKKLVNLYTNKPINSEQLQSLEHLITNTTPLILKVWLHNKLITIKQAAL